MSERTVVIEKVCQNPQCKKRFAQTAIRKGCRSDSGRSFCTNKCAAVYYCRVHGLCAVLVLSLALSWFSPMGGGVAQAGTVPPICDPCIVDPIEIFQPYRAYLPVVILEVSGE